MLNFSNNMKEDKNPKSASKIEATVLLDIVILIT